MVTYVTVYIIMIMMIFSVSVIDKVTMFVKCLADSVCVYLQLCIVYSQFSL